MKNNENNSKNIKEKKEFSLSTMFKSNKFIFFVSLILAILLWVTVSPNRDMTVSKTITVDTADTPVEQLGLEVVGDSTYHLNVKITGKWYVISKITDKDLDINYSLSDVTKAGEYEIPITATKAASNGDFEIGKVTPSKIKIAFDYKYTRSFKVEASAPNIRAKDGYILDTPTIEADSSIVDVTGPRSEVEKIDRVVARVENTETLEASQSYSSTLKLLDKDGKEMDASTLSLSFKTVNVTVPINKMKTVPLKVYFAGAPEYYAKNPLDYSLDVKQLNIVGPAEAVDDINELVVGTINFSDISTDKTEFKFDLKLPSGVKSVDDIQNVTCKLNLSDYAKKTLEVTKFSTVNQNNKTDVSFVTNTVKVTVVGPKSVISKISADDVSLECDISNYKNNSSVKADAVLKSDKYNNIWANGKYAVSIKIS